MSVRNMYAVSVSTTDKGDILITQDDHTDNPHIIELHPDQIDFLIQWLKEAKKETESK